MGRSSNTESEDGLLSTDSPLSNDGDNFSGGSNGSIVLKKGPWTSAEDAILVDYVKRHGEGNWNAVQKHSGLSRCGKSCRLRWTNHLRPNLKKGAFTPEEERLIIKLHAKMGNKWAQMAAHLPGRTDNEIKNYWNTRIKRCQRAGLPLYPPDLSVHAQPENQQWLSLPGIYGDEGCHDIMQSNGNGTSDIMFDSFDIPYAPEFPGITGNFSKGNCFGSPQFYSFASQTIEVAKSAQEPDESMPDYGRDATFDSNRTDSCVSKMSQSLGLCFAYGPDHTKKLLPFGVSQDSCHMSNVIFSASKHFAGAQKLELPSLQYQETGLGLWDPSPEFLDSIVQSPPLSLPRPFLSSHCPSGSNGLLEDLLYEAKALSNQSSDWATSSNFGHGDISDSSALKSRSTEFKDYLGPCSPSSIFNIYTPSGTIGSSLEDDMPACNMKSEVLNGSWTLDAGGDKKQNHSESCRPDAILGSCGCWVRQGVKQQNSFAAATDGILMDDDFGNTATLGLNGPCFWNNMPPARRMSGIFSVLPNL